MIEASPDAQLRGFLARYSPEIAKRARAILATMRKRLPGATELVYDNYNALVIGFGPSERPSEAPFSIVLYPRWVTLCFLDGAGLPDPDRLLQGSGNIVRHIRLEDERVLERPAVKALMTEAIERTHPPFPKRAKRRRIIRSVSPKRRPRR
ncbi:MAG TPA: hypothetical protein VKH42_17595 [Vicinamibacterales bacterium]|nr:hypothetical protein [Vicinamibacterales bacterium]